MTRDIEQVFYSVREELTDGSVIWEIRSRGEGERIASAATEDEALHLEMELNLALKTWSERSALNTIDA